jgi:CO/xanthine dehydrogenase Mo-binding subunit
MEELTLNDMAKELNLRPATIKMRLRKKDIQPTRYIGSAGLYHPSALEAIRNVPPQGRPRKPKP